MPECVSSVNRPKRKRNLADAKPQGLLWAAIIIICMVAIDQFSKLWVVANLSVGGPPVHLIGDFLMLSLVYNEGGAMGTNFGSSVYYLVITLIIIPALLYYLFRNRNDIGIVVPLAFIVSGAAGNLIDRIRLGRVIDFVDVDIPDIFGITRWWTFNVADACISIAIIYTLVRIFFHRPPPKPLDQPK